MTNKICHIIASGPFGFLVSPQNLTQIIHGCGVKRHWLNKCNSRKNTPVIFKAYGYCTFQTCVVTVMLWINQDSFIEDKVAVNVDFHGDINHKVGETHSRNLSLSVRQNMLSTFQDTHIAPSKEYCRRLMSLDNEQFVIVMELPAAHLFFRRSHHKQGFN